MAITAGRILKSGEVNFEGQYRLNHGQSDPRASSCSTGTTESHARIVETQNDFTLIEVTCICGNKTLLRCEYAQPQANPRPDSQAKPPQSAGSEENKRPTN